MIKKSLIMVLVLSLTLVSIGYATTLKITLTVDNEYWVYISTNDSEEGTFIGWDNGWGTTETYYYNLTPGKTYYIHVKGVDWWSYEGFLGEFNLSDSQFQFENGAQSLVTNPNYWRVSNISFGGPYTTPVSRGYNGVSPWGVFPGISASAQWIWHPSDPGGYYSAGSTAYFSTTIYPVPQCNDSIDNDGDGRVDYPEDPGCASSDDNDERDVASIPEFPSTAVPVILVLGGYLAMRLRRGRM